MENSCEQVFQFLFCHLAFSRKFDSLGLNMGRGVSEGMSSNESLWSMLCNIQWHSRLTKYG